MQNGRGYINNAIFFFVSAIETAWNLTGNPMNASGDIKRTHRFSRVNLAGPCGATFHLSLYCSCFLSFKWLHIILTPRSAWLFPSSTYLTFIPLTSKGPVLVVYDLAPKCSQWAGAPPWKCVSQSSPRPTAGFVTQVTSIYLHYKREQKQPMESAAL